MNVWKRIRQKLAVCPHTYYLYRIDPDETLLLVQAAKPLPALFFAASAPDHRNTAALRHESRFSFRRKSSEFASPLSLLPPGFLDALHNRDEEAACLYMAALRASTPQAALARWLRLLHACPGAQVAISQRAPGVWTAQIGEAYLAGERTLAADPFPLLTR